VVEVASIGDLRDDLTSIVPVAVRRLVALAETSTHHVLVRLKGTMEMFMTVTGGEWFPLLQV
jgi:hypothetical protein